MGLIIFLVLWVCAGIINYGMTFAYFHNEFDSIADDSYYQNMNISIIMGLFGLFGIVLIYALSGFAKYGLKFK